MRASSTRICAASDGSWLSTSGAPASTRVPGAHQRAAHEAVRARAHDRLLRAARPRLRSGCAAASARAEQKHQRRARLLRPRPRPPGRRARCSRGTRPQVAHELRDRPDEHGGHAPDREHDADEEPLAGDEEHDGDHHEHPVEEGRGRVEQEPAALAGAQQRAAPRRAAGRGSARRGSASTGCRACARLGISIRSERM